MLDHHLEGERSATAGAEDRRRRRIENVYQRGGVVGLLLGRGCMPSVGSWASSVAPTVVGHDGELVREQVGETVEHPTISRRPHHQE